MARLGNYRRYANGILNGPAPPTSPKHLRQKKDYDPSGRLFAIAFAGKA